MRSASELGLANETLALAMAVRILRNAIENQQVVGWTFRFRMGYFLRQLCFSTRRTLGWHCRILLCRIRHWPNGSHFCDRAHTVTTLY